MNKLVYYISDYFIDEIIGGCELNDNELIRLLEEKKYIVKKIKSSNVNVNFLNFIQNESIIISNFCLVSKECIDYMAQNCKYIIYEHDHKYLGNRDPGIYDQFLAPKDKIINYLFYKNAKQIFCQSNFHKNIVSQNLNINNIDSLNGNLWSLEILNYIKELNNNLKEDSYAILNSNIEHKNTKDAIMFCKHKNYKYNLIQDTNYKKFMLKLSLNKGMIFLPKTPETLSRICVEARMLNMQVITNKNVGATQEQWFGLKGLELINFCFDMRERILNKIENRL